MWDVHSKPSGFTLPEVMLAMALGTIVVLGLVALTEMQAEIAAKARLKAQLIDVHNELHSALSSPSTCLQNFSNVLVNRSRVESRDTTFEPTVDVIQQGAAIVQKNLKI